MDEIMVSVVCITYNHEKYIRQALEGFVLQNTSFKYEVIVHDDASTDGTAAIVREYENQYPDLIQGIYQKENQYSKGVKIIPIIVPQCKGKYIALCEGDDYWIDKNKLQLQVDYFESHPDCMLTAHNSMMLNYADNTARAMTPYEGDHDLSAKEVICRPQGIIPTASMVCRNEMLNYFEFFGNPGIGDYPLQLYCLSKGKVHYIDRIMSVYRHMHEGSYCKRMADDEANNFFRYMRIMRLLDGYNQYTDRKYEVYIITMIHKMLYALIMQYESITVKDFRQICKKYDKESEEEFHTYIVQLFAVYAQIYDREFDNQEIRAFVSNHENIVIMGAGLYAEKLAEKMRNHNISFKGFAVSNDKKSVETYLGMPVWRLDELPFARETTGVIIGIRPVIWDEIIESLLATNITNYMCPYGFKL